MFVDPFKKLLDTLKFCYSHFLMQASTDELSEVPGWLQNLKQLVLQWHLVIIPFQTQTV